jgi:hypothetical protein
MIRWIKGTILILGVVVVASITERAEAATTTASFNIQALNQAGSSEVLFITHGLSISSCGYLCSDCSRFALINSLNAGATTDNDSFLQKYALLMGAMVSGRPVTITYRNGDTTNYPSPDVDCWEGVPIVYGVTIVGP